MSSYQNKTSNVNAPSTGKNVTRISTHVNTSPGNQEQPVDPVVEILGAGRIVAHRVDLALAVGSTTAGLLLSQFWFWSNTPTAKERDGWFWMTADEISEQTGLSREEQMTARKRLVKLNVLEEDKRGTPMKLWFHIRKGDLLILLRDYAETKSKLWAMPKDELEGKPKDQPSGLPTIGNAETYLWALPKDRVGQFRKIARGKAQSLLKGIPKDITEKSSSISSSSSLVSSEVEDNTTKILKEYPEKDFLLENSASVLWTATLGELRQQVNKPTFETHLRGLTPILLENAKLTLSTKNNFTRTWVEGRHKNLIEEIATKIAGEPISIQLSIASETMDNKEVHCPSLAKLTRQSKLTAR